MVEVKLETTYTLANPSMPHFGKRLISRHRVGSDTRDTLDTPMPVCALEVEDLSYSHNSTVTLPVLPTSAGEDCSEPFQKILPDDASSAEEFHIDLCNSFIFKQRTEATKIQESHRRSTLNIVAITYHFLKKNPGYKLLVTGHTDRSGEDEYNFVLSAKRAKNFLCLLNGDSDTWVEISHGQHKAEDYQRICAHYSDFFGWNCHPGEVDGIHGPMTSAALKNLQASYNEYFNKSIAMDGVLGRQTWGAFFDLYMHELACLLGISIDELDAERSGLRLVDGEGLIACGERFPIDKPSKDNFRSVENRRVELLFFHEDFLPNLDSHRPGGSIRSGNGGDGDSAAYRPGHPPFIILLPVWWEGEPLPSQYTPKFEVLDSEEDLEGLEDDPESDEFDSQISAGSEEEDPNDEWAFLDDMDDLPPQWRDVRKIKKLGS
jgi:hypothetical protein